LSRTDKDRPYWVKTRDEGVPHHDHTRLGEAIWHTKYFRDDEGNPIIERVPYYLSAKHIIAEYQRPKVPRDYMDSWYAMNTISGARSPENSYLYLNVKSDSVNRRKEGEVFAEAFEAMELGDHTKLIMAGTYSRQKREAYIAGYVADHCTIDEDEPRGSLYRQYPCYMTWNLGNSMFRCSCDSCNPGVNYSGVRREKRDILRKAIKAYNSGDEDWEDGFEQYNLKPSRKSFQSWW
jgi:hypothetical protein